MATTADIKNGLCIEYNSGLYSIVQFQHVKPGKGPAFVRTKLKNLTTGKVIENTFNSGVRINVVRIERRPYQYLYKEEMGYVFMHTQTFEQITIDEKLIDHPQIMKEGIEVEVVFHAETETPLTCDLPPHVILEVTYSEPGLRGDTSSSTAMKHATLETGYVINVPLFINVGDKIKVDTRDLTYAERVK
ncbi:MAG: elongation factor P [Bacteroidetes bacterium GWF2_33_38]|nr:MAG: elongation factor P [Bacteroidetes bacterium GWF2_33_38]OFY68510.1 MAG: elongation factor P [Bacteroidetes bacterium RIFOXYA12_FULL_33_9]OFY91615.1 MAG: elongation factor P [Bacteroidetes bacterium RIFOXYA2_FULL_33_7]HBX52579.1 elongation factor P [Bacteroidales bacterium]